MEKEEVTIGNPIAVDGVTLIPIVRVSLNSQYCKSGISLFSVKQPIALVVISVSARTAFRITGEEVSIDQLIQEFPDIKGMLEGI